MTRWVTAGIAVSIVLAACGHDGPRARARRRPDATVGVDADVAGDAGVAVAPRCPVRAQPPDVLSSGVVEAGVPSMAWSDRGREWGVAWTESRDGAPAIFFVRVGADGRRRSTPVRISESGYRAGNPSVAWGDGQWLVAFDGGAGRFQELWLARTDTRGTPVGRPRRITARDRDDRDPSLGYDGQDLMLTWTARLPREHRYAVVTLKLSRAGYQLGPPLRLNDRAERLSSTALVRNRNGWAVAWLVSGNEPTAIAMGRIDGDGNPRGYPARVAVGPLGGIDAPARFSLAWDGERYGMVWDEVRDGMPHVFFHAVTARVDDRSGPVMLSARRETAISPTIVALGAGTFLTAWMIERGTSSVVKIASLDGAGAARGDAIEVQGLDGEATTPVLAVGDEDAGLVTLARNAVSFHRVILAPCAVIAPR